MGILNLFTKSDQPRLVRFPSGSFTVDSEGRVVTSTLPQSFPRSNMLEIGREVLAYFRGARQSQMPVRELIVQYPALKLSAREMRGGAVVFISPQTLTQN